MADVPQRRTSGRQRASLNYADLNKGKMGNAKGQRPDTDSDPVNNRPKRKSKTPKKVNLKPKKLVRGLNSSGQWTVTLRGLNRNTRSASQSQGFPREGDLDMAMSLCNINDLMYTSVAASEDGEIVDLDAQGMGEFEEALQPDNPEALRLEQEVLELEKWVQEKKLQSLKKKKAELLKALEEDDD